MRFCWSTLRVKDMDESIKFYEEVIGLNLERRFEAGQGVEIAFLSDGDTEIELICDGSGNDADLGLDISWGFEVDSIEDAISHLKEKGIDISGGPFQPNPFVRFIYVLDPNGMKIQIVENVKA